MKKNDKNVDNRIIPHSIIAEQSVLGTMILHNPTIVEVMEVLGKEDFYSPAHQILFETIINLNDKKIAVDLTTLIEELKRINQLDSIGGASYVVSLEQYVIAVENIKHHANIVKDKSKLRSLIDGANKILDMAFDEPNEVNEILDKSEKLIFDISQNREHKDFIHISDITMEVMDEIEARYKHKKELTGIPTGFKKLDSYTSGFQRSDLIILAARPSIGKTALALNIAGYLALDENIPVGIFSLEMSSNQIYTRILCNASRVSAFKVRGGYISGSDLDTLSQFSMKISEAPIYIDDTPDLTMLELRAKARRLKAINPDLSLIIVDYLQLIRGSSGRKEINRQQEVAEISRSLKAIARELKIPVLAISQLSRLIEQRKGEDKRPVLSDLRESGAIEQDADLVMFIHRDKPKGKKEAPKRIEEIEFRDEETQKNFPGDICELIIAKQRNGPLGTVNLVFLPYIMGYRPLDEDKL